jgi:hypothetical protein
MLKQVNVTFEFDPETEVVSNVHCFVDGIEKKKTTTRKKPSLKQEEIEDEAIVTRESNRLVFNNKANLDLGLSPGDRVILLYEVFGESRVPIIGKDIAFDDEGSGNKVTKNQTISYRGKVNTILSEYGTDFKLEPYKEGIFKLISSSGEVKVDSIQSYNDVVEEANNLDISILSDEDNIEIEEIPFKL